jgi:hypothetical protein
MVWFEVFIPAKEPGLPNVTLTVEAQNWIGALRTGLSNLGEGHEAIANVMCDIKEDNSIHVTDVSTRRVFRLREVQPPSVPSGRAVAPSSSLAPENTMKLPASPPPPPPADGPRTPPSGTPALKGPARPVSMPDVGPIVAPIIGPSGVGSGRLSAADFEGGATIPNPVAPSSPPAAPPSFIAPAVAAVAPEHSVPWTRMAPPQEDNSATLELPAEAPILAPPPRAPAMPTQQQWPPLPSAQPSASLAPTQPSFSPPVAPPTPSPPLAPPSRTAPVTAESAAPAGPPAPLAPATAATAATPLALSKKKKSAEPAEATERVARAPGPNEKKTGPVPAPTPRGSPAPPPKRSSGQFDGAAQPARREVSLPTLAPPSAPIGRTGQAAAPQAVADAVADVFDATQDLLMEDRIAPETIAARLLDIALQHVPAESGSFYLADVNGHELHFAAVRGPKAKEIQQKKLSVKVGQGIIGFCALEGVCLSVSDIQKDPRYFSAVADAVGYSPRDTLCASAEKDGRLFGALQLINSTGGFSPIHMEVLRYIGLTAASLLERHFDNL